LGNKKIRVNSISPGWIDVSEHRMNAESEPVILSEQDHSQHPAGRVGRPEDIAAACIFLASDEAGFITGTNLTVDGGMTIKMIYV
jgi:NAD(P)-dependent dehydrogenase (short-subunit alcohol dehydrogenase family)